MGDRTSPTATITQVVGASALFRCRGESVALGSASACTAAMRLVYGTARPAKDSISYKVVESAVRRSWRSSFQHARGAGLSPATSGGDGFARNSSGSHDR
ncbi:hypothetical protein GCM10010177_62050 [Actinomadura citrea]|nr:hypothetical protein GCM10010177_62050 [Actinomadura citrea]